MCLRLGWTFSSHVFFVWWNIVFGEGWWVGWVALSMACLCSTLKHTLALSRTLSPPFCVSLSCFLLWFHWMPLKNLIFFSFLCGSLIGCQLPQWDWRLHLFVSQLHCVKGFAGAKGRLYKWSSRDGDLCVCVCVCVCLYMCVCVQINIVLKVRVNFETSGKQVTAEFLQVSIINFLCVSMTNVWKCMFRHGIKCFFKSNCDLLSQNSDIFSRNSEFIFHNSYFFLSELWEKK